MKEIKKVANWNVHLTADELVKRYGLQELFIDTNEYYEADNFRGENQGCYGDAFAEGIIDKFISHLCKNFMTLFPEMKEHIHVIGIQYKGTDKHEEAELVKNFMTVLDDMSNRYLTEEYLFDESQINKEYNSDSHGYTMAGYDFSFISENFEKYARDAIFRATLEEVLPEKAPENKKSKI